LEGELPVFARVRTFAVLAAALCTAALLPGAAGAETAGVPWSYRAIKGNAGECLAISAAGYDFTYSWTTQDPVCLPKVSFDQHSFHVWQYLPRTDSPSIADVYPQEGPYHVTMPGIGLYGVDITSSDPRGTWFPATDGLVTVGTDSDGDMIPDALDHCPAVPAVDQDGFPLLGASADRLGCPNGAPVVHAGADIALNGQDTVTVKGTATDDGLPSGDAPSTSWTQVSGPGKAVFAHPEALTSAVSFPAPGRYVLRLTATDGQLAAHDDLVVTVTERYRVELRAWIPHPHVVDPVHPVPEPHPHANSVDSMHACGIVPGPLWQSSTFRGDNHRGFDGGYRGRVWAEFTWDGTAVSAVRTTTDPAQLFGVTHRDFVIEPVVGAAKKCTEAERATQAATVTRTGTTGLHLDLHTSNPLVDWFPKLGHAPAIDSDLWISFPSRTRITFTAKTDEFPDHGFRAWRNGKPFYTRAVNQAACVNALGVAGAWNLFHRLTSQTNNGTWTSGTHAAPHTYDRTCT
jgi:hypothetical protein